ncbi:hypothetical protein J0W73_19485, partial [Clostridioides difficile]|nr:hypothetical protein [Clostridioides difficile]
GVGHGQEQQVKHGDAGTGAGGVLHRSGSGSSSSSEDDGQGGRRKKKGVVEKIKEKLSGDGGDVTGEQKTATVGEGGAAVGGGECGGEEGAEKKGIMDKIKEKLPGGHTQ